MTCYLAAETIAERGFDPRTFGLWAQHANHCATPLSGLRAGASATQAQVRSASGCGQTAAVARFRLPELGSAHAGSRTRVTSMGGLYDASEGVARSGMCACSGVSLCAFRPAFSPSAPQGHERNRASSIARSATCRAAKACKTAMRTRHARVARGMLQQLECAF